MSLSLLSVTSRLALGSCTHTLPQHKTRTLVSTTKGTQHLTGELKSASDLDFYIDGVSV